MKVLAFTPTRANTPTRAKLLLSTITQARDTAGMDFDWHLWCQSGTLAEKAIETAKSAGLVQGLFTHPENRGQHPAFNEALAMANAYDFLLRLDDDADFMTKRWLAKLVELSTVFDHKAVITPAVKGLKFPPPRTTETTVGGHKVEYLLEAIGGLCRLHPVELLKEFDYVSDVRLPLGSGDASGMGTWCLANQIPMVWSKSIRVRHTTKEQENLDGEHFILHNLFQRIPYIPALSE